jgi:hypothetical protein
VSKCVIDRSVVLDRATPTLITEDESERSRRSA